MAALLTSFDKEFYQREYKSLYIEYFGEGAWKDRKEYLDKSGGYNDLELLSCGVEYLNNAIEDRERLANMPLAKRKKEESGTKSNRGRKVEKPVYNEWKRFRQVEKV